MRVALKRLRNFVNKVNITYAIPVIKAPTDTIRMLSILLI